MGRRGTDPDPLLDGIPHTVRVIAMNAGGDGPPSNDVTARPRPGTVGAATGTDDDVTVTSEVGALAVKWGAGHRGQQLQGAVEVGHGYGLRRDQPPSHGDRYESYH